VKGPSLDLSEFLTGYLAEVDEHLRSAAANLLAAESNARQGSASPRPVRELYRSLHTIKGLSAMIGVEPIVEIAHAMETVLREADRAGGRLSSSAIEPLLAGLQAIEQRVKVVETRGAVPGVPAPLVAALAALDPTPAAPRASLQVVALPPELESRLTAAEREQLAAAARDGRRAARLEFVPTAARAAAGVNITSIRERLGEIAEIVKVVPLSRPGDERNPGALAFVLLLVTKASDAELAAAAGVEPDCVSPIGQVAPPAELPPVELPPAEDPLEETAGRPGLVRVEVRRLDDALEKLSALVVTRFRLSHAVAAIAEAGGDVRDLRQIVQENERQLRDLRTAIMRARMVPAREMLERVPMLVRGLSRSTGKAVRLELDVGHAELDKAVADRVFPAIVHLVRNAVDHALEPTDARLRLGKAAEGLIRVRCSDGGNNQVELCVEDDGRGIDRAKVARRAGRDVPDTMEGLLGLIVLPGVSTRDEATTTSGRGMGMDIVRRIVVDELGGEIALRTTPGQGTSFVLRVPLSITIVDALTFRCGAQAFVVPVSSVEEIVEVDPAQVTLGPGGKGRAQVRMLERRGVPVPLVSLDRVFRLEEHPGRLRVAIVVKRNGRPFAFEVDQMLGQKEVVVRPLEDPLIRQPGIVGSTDLGDGRPTLVLDLVALSGKLSRRKTDLPA
jgi:two-component system chemotaxis sensor kinase CheA